MKNIIKRTLLALGLVSVVSIANATPVEWILDSTQTTFSFVQTWGTFTYDADTNTYSDSVFYFSTNINRQYSINSGDANGLNYGVINSTGIFSLSFDTPLTNAGGIVSGTGSDNSNTWGFTIHAATSVPEPEAFASMLAGLALVGFITRRKSV